MNDQEIEELKKMSNWKFFWVGFCLKGGVLPLILLVIIGLAYLGY